MEDIELKQHGFLTKAQIVAMLDPGALDAKSIAGRRVRWAIRCMRSENAEATRASDALKQRHLELGAVEVLVHRAPWLPETE